MYFRGFSARMPFEKGYTDSKLNGISMGWNNKRSTGNRVYARFMQGFSRRALPRT